MGRSRSESGPCVCVVSKQLALGTGGLTGYSISRLPDLRLQGGVESPASSELPHCLLVAGRPWLVWVKGSCLAFEDVPEKVC